MFYQDVNEQFEGYTQQTADDVAAPCGCFIRMSMNNLKDIHNEDRRADHRYELFYQDVNEQFEGYTQRCEGCGCRLAGCFIRMSMNNLKDIHNIFCADLCEGVVVLSGCQ